MGLSVTAVETALRMKWSSPGGIVHRPTSKPVHVLVDFFGLSGPDTYHTIVSVI
jgi:hypothetical protein